MENHKSEDLDRLLDAGLVTYASEEPRSGLEERILNRVRGAERSWKPRFWLWAAVAVPVAACLVLVGILSRPGTPPGPPRIAEVRPQPPAARAPERPVRVVSKARVRHSAALPKRAQFPTMTPLTAEESALVELVKRDPQAARGLLIEQPANAGPIEIAPIQIAPLESGNSNEDDNL